MGKCSESAADVRFAFTEGRRACLDGVAAKHLTHTAGVGMLASLCAEILQTLMRNEARRRHAEIFGPASQAGGRVAPRDTMTAGLRILHWIRGDGSPHAEEDEELPLEIEDGAGCGTVDVESAAGEATTLVN